MTDENVVGVELHHFAIGQRNELVSLPTVQCVLRRNAEVLLELAGGVFPLLDGLALSIELDLDDVGMGKLGRRFPLDHFGMHMRFLPCRAGCATRHRAGSAHVGEYINYTYTFYTRQLSILTS